MPQETDLECPFHLFLACSRVWIPKGLLQLFTEVTLSPCTLQLVLHTCAAVIGRTIALKLSG